MELRSYSNEALESDSNFEAVPSPGPSVNMLDDGQGSSISNNHVNYSFSSPDEERNVRARVSFTPLPYDAITTIPRNFKMISIKDLVVEKHTVHDMLAMKKSYLALQLLRIVCGNNVNDKSAGVYKFFSNKKGKESGSSRYTRLFLFRDVSTADGQVVYIIEARKQNDLLWSKFPEKRDNGTVTIGSYIVVLNPKPITIKMSNDIPILDTRGGSILLRSPEYSGSKIFSELAVNVTRSFVLPGNFSTFVCNWFNTMF